MRCAKQGEDPANQGTRLEGPMGQQAVIPHGVSQPQKEGHDKECCNGVSKTHVRPSIISVVVGWVAENDGCRTKRALFSR